MHLSGKPLARAVFMKWVMFSTELGWLCLVPELAKNLSIVKPIGKLMITLGRPRGLFHPVYDHFSKKKVGRELALGTLTHAFTGGGAACIVHTHSVNEAIH